MKQCDGNHPSGFAFFGRETMRVSFKLGPRNAGAERRGHVSVVVMQYVTNQAIKYDRVPLLDTLELSFTQDGAGVDRVDATCVVEYYGNSEWHCPARSLEAARVSNILHPVAPDSFNDGGLLN